MRNRRTATYAAKRGQRGTKFSAAQVQRAVLRQASSMTRMMPRAPPAAFYGRSSLRQGELKSVDVPTTTNLISTTATFTLLNGVQTGNAFYNRVGNRIQMKSLYLTGSYRDSGLAAGAPIYTRVMVIYDRAPAIASGAGAFPAIATVLSSYDNAGAITSTVLDHMNPNLSNRFVMLMDQRLTGGLDSRAAGQTNPLDQTIYDYEVHQTKRFIKLRGLETQYITSTNPAAIGDISAGGLYLVTFGNTAAATAPYNFVWTSRLRYYD